MIVSAEEMKCAEEAAFASGISASDLMESVGEFIASSVSRFFPVPSHCSAFYGKGNNGGDALVAARHLIQRGWSCSLVCPFPEEELSPLAKKQLDALRPLLTAPANEKNRRPQVVIDGLLGLGSKGDPSSPIAASIAEIRRLRNQEGAFVVAVDIPSGLDPSSGTPSPNCVHADLTVAAGAAKTALFSDAATNAVGRIAVAPLPSLNFPKNSLEEIVTPSLLRSWLPPRDFDSYKGVFGHTCIIAGSPGYFGAAKLCALGALHAGAGLVTILAKPKTFPFLATTCPPEIMVKPVNDFREVFDFEHDSLAIGPGLLGEPLPEITEIIRGDNAPAVIDAAALDVFQNSLKVLRNSSAPRILTPHAGEFARFYKKLSLDRNARARAFVEEHPCVLLFKGARTLVAAPGKPVFYNSTGTPGMATAGMGDVLTGVIAALLGQKLRPTASASLGAWLCGRAAELAIASGESEQSLSAGKIPEFLGKAFREIRHSDL